VFESLGWLWCAQRPQLITHQLTMNMLSRCLDF
jgi:hypothetical protein